MKKIVWLFYYMKERLACYRRIYLRCDINRIGKRYAKTTLLSGEEGNRRIAEALQSGRPFACCRYGFSEMSYLIAYEKKLVWGKKLPADLDVAIKQFELRPDDGGAGFERYCELMRKSCEAADLVGVWVRIWMSEHYLSTVKSNINRFFCDARAVEPYYYAAPWSYAMKGKKVLVISPFFAEIEKQYKENREKLFQNKKVLPEFELFTLPSVWYYDRVKDPRFQTWFEACDYLFEEAMKIEFDVALLGCSAFGFLLAVRFKEAGRQAIQIGGALQILFGIKGKRWDEKEFFRNLYNEYWIYPAKPNPKMDVSTLDEGCYW